MQIGLLTSVLARNLAYEEAIDRAGAQGVESVEIDVGSDHAPGGRTLLNATEAATADTAALARLRAPLVRHGLTVTSLFYYGHNNLDPDLDRRRRVQAGLRDAIRAAARLGATAVVTATGSPLPRVDGSRLNPWGIYYHGAVHPEGRALMEQGFQIFAEAYRPLGDFAAEHGVRIAFEPSAVGGGAGAVAHSPETFDTLFRIADHPALGLNFDPSHFHWQGIDVLGYAARLAREGRLISCHAKDNEILWERVRYAGVLGDGWWRHRLPGWGQINWVDLLTTLRRNGYDGPITLEHEDPLFGWRFDGAGRLIDLDLALEGCRQGLAHLRHARRLALDAVGAVE